MYLCIIGAREGFNITLLAAWQLHSAVISNNHTIYNTYRHFLYPTFIVPGDR